MAEAQRFPNGFIPENVLVTFGSGYRSDYGYWKHQLSVSSYTKHKKLQELSLARTGKKLQISTGNNAYRDYAGQVFARQHHGNGAAVPGTSSHGGYWEGKNTLAMDYGNWSYVYNGNRNTFYQDVRAAGLAPGLISPERGYPDEPWHVVDLEPWIVPAGGGGLTPIPKKEIRVNVIRRSDKDAPVSAGIGMAPGGTIYLNTVGGNPASGSNIVGPVGEYVIAAHVYATGVAGDVITVRLVHNTDGVISNGYQERMTVDRDGYIRGVYTTNPYVGSGTSVTLQVVAAAGNQATVRVGRLDSIATQFEEA